MSVKLEPGVAEVVPSTQAANPAIAELGDFVGEELHQAMAGPDPPAMVDTVAEGAAALSVIEPPLPAVDPAVIIEQAGRGYWTPIFHRRRGGTEPSGPWPSWVLLLLPQSTWSSATLY